MHSSVQAQLKDCTYLNGLFGNHRYTQMTAYFRSFCTTKSTYAKNTAPYNVPDEHLNERVINFHCHFCIAWVPLNVLELMSRIKMCQEVKCILW